MFFWTLFTTCTTPWPPMDGQCMSTASPPTWQSPSATSAAVLLAAALKTILEWLLMTIAVTAILLRWKRFETFWSLFFSLLLYLLFSVSFQQKWIYFIKVLRGKQVEVVWGTCHVDVGETPFFISVDMTKKVIVITIRGTLSMKDIITDLNAECELIPLQNINHEWKGHKVNFVRSSFI